MSHSMISTVVTSFASLLLLSCADTSAAASPLTLNEANAGQTVELCVGQEMNVILNENATTGYQWEVALIDKSVIEQSAKPEFKPDSDLIGAGSKKTFHFRSVAPGKAALRLVYRRSWEKDVPPVRTFEVTIKVK